MAERIRGPRNWGEPITASELSSRIQQRMTLPESSLDAQRWAGYLARLQQGSSQYPVIISGLGVKGINLEQGGPTGLILVGVGEERPNQPIIAVPEYFSRDNSGRWRDYGPAHTPVIVPADEATFYDTEPAPVSTPGQIIDQYLDTGPALAPPVERVAAEPDEITFFTPAPQPTPSFSAGGWLFTDFPRGPGLPVQEFVQLLEGSGANLTEAQARQFSQEQLELWWQKVAQEKISGVLSDRFRRWLKVALEGYQEYKAWQAEQEAGQGGPVAGDGSTGTIKFPDIGSGDNITNPAPTPGITIGELMPNGNGGINVDWEYWLDELEEFVAGNPSNGNVTMPTTTTGQTDWTQILELLAGLVGGPYGVIAQGLINQIQNYLSSNGQQFGSISGDGMSGNLPTATYIPGNNQLVAMAGTKVIADAMPGYVVVDGSSIPGAVPGAKYQVEKCFARKMGWWKPQPKAKITASEYKAIQKAARVEKKIKTLASNSGLVCRTRKR